MFSLVFRPFSHIGYLGMSGPGPCVYGRFLLVSCILVCVCSARVPDLSPPFPHPSWQRRCPGCTSRHGPRVRPPQCLWNTQATFSFWREALRQPRRLRSALLGAGCWAPKPAVGVGQHGLGLHVHTSPSSHSAFLGQSLSHPHHTHMHTRTHTRIHAHMEPRL